MNAQTDSNSSTIHPSILRAYDIRGVVGKTLDSETAYYIGEAFATAMLRASDFRKVAVGWDGRLSSPELSDALVRGMLSTGADVLKIGLGPTPMLYYAAKQWADGCGIMVTGSHNPPDHNGFKMMMGGKPFFGDAIQAIGALIEQDDFNDGDGEMTRSDVMDPYVAHLLNFFPQGQQGQRPLKVAWDPGNGAAGVIVEKLAEKLPGEHILMNTKIDGTFPAHHPDPSVAENMQQLIDAVKKEGCDVGLAFDGDGDRLGVVDHEGNILWGDQLMMVFAKDLLAANPGATMIADVKASQVLFDSIAKWGGKPLMWKTGHSFIKSKMAEIKALFAGEMSGHVFFAENNGFDDGPFAAVKLLAILSGQEPHYLQQFIAGLPQTHSTPEIRVDVDEQEKFQIVDTIKEKVINEGKEVATIDGVRVKEADGWWLVRASNTGGSLVVRIEADSNDALQRIQSEVAGYLQDLGVAFEQG